MCVCVCHCVQTENVVTRTVSARASLSTQDVHLLVHLLVHRIEHEEERCMEMTIETELVRQLCAWPQVSVHAQLCSARSRVGQSIKTMDGLQWARMLHEPQAADRLAAPAGGAGRGNGLATQPPCATWIAPFARSSFVMSLRSGQWACARWSIASGLHG